MYKELHCVYERPVVVICASLHLCAFLRYVFFLPKMNVSRCFLLLQSVVCYVKAQTKELTNQIKELKAEIAKKSETERLALETVEKLKAELARKSVKDDRVFGDLQDTISRMFRAVEELGKRLPNPTTENSR